MNLHNIKPIMPMKSNEKCAIPVVTCCCGLVITDSEIEYGNRCNEEGEEYYEGTADCKCGKEYEWSEWGECQSLTEAKEDLIEYISNCW